MRDKLKKNRSWRVTAPLLAWLVCAVMSSVSGSGIAWAQQAESDPQQKPPAADRAETPSTRWRVSEPMELQEPSVVDHAETNGDLQSEYRVGPGDVIEISVWKEPEVSSTVVVRPDGKISLPLIGEVLVDAKTPLEIQTLLAERLDPLIKSPNITVTVREIRSKKVYVLGQVIRPGVFDILQPKTVLQVLTEAGGPAPFAKQKAMYVLRTQAGKQEKLPFNYKEVIQGKKIEQNIPLKPGDTIVVP